MLNSGISTSIEPVHPPFGPVVGAVFLPGNCRIWQGAPLGSSAGSAVFDTCSSGAVSITEQQPLSSYVTDDYFLVLAEMCGDGEVITEINAAPSNGGWAGLELREDTTSSARKFGLRTQTGAFVQVFRRDTPGQAAAAYSFVKPTHKWLKINRYGSYFTASTSYDGNNWITVYATALSLANCIKAGVYTQSAYAGTPSSALFNQVSISDSSPVTEVNFADSTLTASPGDSIQICVEVANSCECAPASVDVALTSSSSPHLAGYTTQNLAFTDSSTQQCFTIVLADTAATASYTFSLQNVSGGNNGQVGSVPNLSLSVVDSSMASDFFCGIIPPIGYDFFTEAKVHDRFGNIYDFAQIKIPISNYNPSSRLVNNGPIPPGFENCSCQDLGINTGNFNLWFEDCDLETGTGFDDPVVGQDRRRVMCTVFEYLSATILPNPSQCSDSIPIVNVKVQPSDAITNNGYYGSNLPAMPSSRGAAASACYFDNIGIVHGDPWIIINSGAYPPHTAIDEYHGLMRVNFSEGSNIDWHLGLAAGPNDPMNPRTDLYSVCLHEALHMLDFASSFNVGNNNLNDNSYLEGGYFAFDRFMRLVDDFGAPLSNSEPVIINDPGPSLFWHFNPSINVPNDFTVGCNDPNTGPDLVFEGANGNYPLLFGNAFVSGVSFSHLATVCDGANIAPLVMQTNWGANDTRRTIMPPEEDILTQIGYSLNGIDSCSVGGVSNIGPPCTDSIYRIGLCTPGVIYIPIDDLIEDGPNADSIAFIHLLNPIAGDGEVIDSNGILYFRFIPSRLGRVEFIYVPVGCNGQWGNNTRLFIEVFADDSCAGFCPSPVSCNEGYFDGLICTEYHSCGTLLSKNACNLICNPEICATAYRAQFVNNLIWPLTNSNIDQTFIDIPGWYVSHSTPDFIPDDSVFPGSGYLRMFTSSGVTADYSEGVFSFVDFSPENNYFLTLYAGVAPVFETTLDDTTSLIINLVNSNQIIYDPITPVVDGPSQEVIDWVPPDSLLGSPDSLRLARIGTCFSPDSTIFNAIRFYIEPFGAGNFGRLDLAIDNIEIVEDNFYAGDDKTVSCGNQVLLGGQFCMASDVEVTYQWMVDGQIIAEYEVLNGDITINMGNIDTATHELILFPTASDTFTLYRQFTDLGGLPPSFIPCNSTDTVAITVLQGIPTADFSYLADESDCSVSFESLQQGTHSWDFGDGETDTTSMPVHNYDVENIDTFLVIHTLANDCGTNSDTAQIIIDCCDSPTLTLNSTHDGCGNVDFSVTATGNNPTLVAYNWDFGDGATDTSATPGHTYAGEGTYIVSLTATNDCGEQASATDTLIIDFPDAPDATFTISIDTCSRTVNFTSAPGQEANYHRWEFGDAANNTADGPGLTAASFTYPAAGTYTAGHTVDELTCGESDFASVNFTIPSLPPLGNPTQVFATHLECGEVEFQLRDSLGGTLFFGDGSSAIADTAYIYHTYTSLVDYMATYILDNGCEQDSFSFTVPLAQYAPQAEAVLNGTFCLGLVVAAADTLAGNSYQWQFGAAGTAAGGQATYTFDSAGLYDVILTVSDTCGNSAADTLQVEVEECDTTALLCGCPAGYEILGGDGDTVRLSTLLALGILPPAVLFNSCLAVAPGVTLWADTDYDIAGGEVYMHPGSEILVRPDGPEITFAVSGMEQTTGIQGCGQMWKGIRVEDSRLVLKGARVADARYAVHARNKAKVLVDASYFNRNFASLYFNGSGSESFSLEAFLATEVLGYQPLLPPFAGQSPAPGGRPYAGIEIHNDPSLKSIGSTGGAANRFDGLRNGILTENTPLAVHNSSFTDIVEATSEPYPLSGFGIRHSGGAAHPLLQRGSGNSPSSAVSFRNCAQAIRVEGTTADIAANNMVECKNGVRVQLAQNRNVLVHDNLMDVSTIGIELLQNAPLEALEVEGNTITTQRRGIAVGETGIAFADATVRFNTVTLQGKGYGIRLNAVNNLDATNNEIFLDQAVQPAEGIQVSGATSCLVKENKVSGSGGSNLGITGLKVWDSDHTIFDCNTFTELGTGAEFRGSCIGSTVSTNTFDPGMAGMGRGLVYNPNLNIGVQSHAGNLWEVNTGLPNDGYGVAAAVSYASGINLLVANRYEVNDEDPPIRPSSFVFPNIGGIPLSDLITAWFPVDNEGEAGICIPGGEVEVEGPKDIHRQAARGELQDSLYEEVLLWAAQLQLYKQLSEAVEWPSDEALDSFYLANANTAIGRYYFLEKAKEELFDYDSLQGATLNNWEAQLQVLIGQILEKDSLIAAGILGLETSRDSLLVEASTLCVSLDSLESIALQSQLALAQQALTNNGALTDTADYQSNEKAFNAIFLNTLAQGASAIDSIQEAALLSIAQKCPLSDGRAVYYARSLYQLITDKDFEANCEEQSTLREHVISEASTQQETVDNIRVFPSPASSELFIEGYCERIEFTDRIGQAVLERQLSPEERRHTIQLPKLPDGLYFLRVYKGDVLISVHKLVILN